MKSIPSKIFSQKTNEIVLVASIILFAFLLLFATRTDQQIRDSLVYAQSAKTGVEMFHPHHLLYTPIVRLFFLTFSSICETCDVILGGQIHNILWAIVAIVSFFFILRRLWENILISLLGAMLLLVARGFWELSTQTTMYVPATGTLSLLAAFLLTRRTSRLNFLEQLIIALIWVLAILYHQSNVLFCLPLAYYLIARERKEGARAWVIITALAGMIVLSVYILVFLSTGASWSIAQFIRFCLTYTFEICFNGQCAPRPSYWGAVDNFGTSGLYSLLQSLLWNFVSLPERLNQIILPVFTLGLALIFGWNIIQVTRHATHQKDRSFFLVWALTYLAFFFWWLPTYEHPLVITVFPILLLAFLLLKDGRDKLAVFNLKLKTGEQVAAAVALFCLIFLAGINFYINAWPLHRSKSDAYLEAAGLARLAPKECLILTEYKTWNHLRYYFDREKGVIQAKYPLGYFYTGESLPKAYQLREGDCIFVLASFVDPDYILEGYSALGSNGYNEPSKWLAYMEWLFAFEYDTNHKLVTSRDFEVIILEEGGPYLSLSSSKKKVDGLPELFQALDNQIDGHLDDKAQPFQSWLSKAQAGLTR